MDASSLGCPANPMRVCRSNASPAVSLRLDDDARGVIRSQLATPTCSQPGDSVPSLIGPLAAILKRCVSLNADAQTQVRKRRKASASVAEFEGRCAPTISIDAYLHRFARFAKCSPVCFVMAQNYLEQLSKVDPALTPGPRNVHRLLTVGIMLAAKLMDDRYYNNAYYAKIGGFSLDELNRLEIRMMMLLDYKLRVSKTDICTTLRRLTLQAAQQEHSEFVPAFKQLIHPAELAASDHANLLMRIGATSVCTADTASVTPITQRISPLTSTFSLQDASKVAVTDGAHLAPVSQPDTTQIQSERAASDPTWQTRSPTECSAMKHRTSEAASGNGLAPSNSREGTSRPDTTKALSVRFSDQQHSGDISTLLTAAALSAASLEESDSTQWRASRRTSSIASACSSAGSSCHRAAAQACRSVGSIPAC